MGILHIALTLCSKENAYTEYGNIIAPSDSIFRDILENSITNTLNIKMFIKVHLILKKYTKS